MEQLKSPRNTSAAGNILYEEASALRIIRKREFADPVKIQKVVTFMDRIGVAGEPEYALRLADEVLVVLAASGEPLGRSGNSVLLSSAINNWLAGNEATALIALDRILESESVAETEIVKAASVKARILWSRDQKSESVDFLTSLLPRLIGASEAKASIALFAAQYSGMIQDYASALSMIESVQQEIGITGNYVSVETRQFLDIELAWINLNLGHTDKAMDTLENSSLEVDSVENPRLHNFKAYVSSWCMAVQSGQPLGDSIRDSNCKFVHDPSIVDSQHTIGAAWSKVQKGDVLGAHTLFLAAAKGRKPETPAMLVLNSREMALEGVFYTATELGRNKLAVEAVTELQSLQSNDRFTISVSGLVHGTVFTLGSTDESHMRLSSMRSLRRRGQFTQGLSSISVVRCIFAECKLLQEAGLHEQELELREYGKSLMASTAEEKTRLEFENEVRIATLTAILGDNARAEAMMEQVLAAILSMYDVDDELAISARYAKAIILDNFSADSASLEEFRSLQRDIEEVFGANSTMNLKAQYSTACSLERAGESSEALEILLEVEGNPNFRSVSKEFRRLVISKVADLFFDEGKYTRAVNWYKLVARSTFNSPDDLTQRDLNAHLMYGQAQARAGQFKEARSYFEIVMAQQVTRDSKNFDILVESRVAFAACAESLGAFKNAADEYLETVMMFDEFEKADDPRLWDLNISVARNYELSDDQTNAFLHYDEALRIAETMTSIDDVLLQEIHWRRECCRH